MNPVWQPECPDCAEEASDDLWQAAFEAWPQQEDSHRAASHVMKLLGLPNELVPPLCHAVCSYQAVQPLWLHDALRALFATILEGREMSAKL